MNEFMAIDFETGNPQRVSACATCSARTKSDCSKDGPLDSLSPWFGLDVPHVKDKD